MTEPPRFAVAEDIAAFARVPLDERLAGRDLIAILAEQAAGAAGRAAIDYRPRGLGGDPATTFSGQQLMDGAAAIAEQLVALGVGPTDVVASLLTNGPGTIAAALAALATGVLSPINIYLETAQIRTLLAECRAKVVLVPHDQPEAIAATLAAVAGRDGPRPLVVDTATLPAAGPAAPLQPRALGERVALFHTGGTTGLPKFVPLSARHVAAATVISNFAYGYGQADTVLCAMPMFHVGGLFACSLFPLAAGSRLAVLGPLGYRGAGVVAALPATLEALGVSVAVGPPTVMAQLAARPPARSSRLRLFVSGAAALPRVLGARLTEATGVPVVEPWGLTESTLAVTCGPRDGAIRQGSVGLALPYCAVKAVRTDATGKAAGDCAVDEIGTLAIHGPMVFDGYLGRTDADQPFFDGGWLDSGDLGRVDRDGFVWVTGRAKELIKRGGHGIDPGMIEDALTAHEAVALAAAVGKPDAYAGEVPVAYVELRAGAVVDADTLIAFARARIPERAAVPKEIVFLPKLPVTAVGKVHKQPLRLDIARRAAEECVRAVAGAGAALEIEAVPHPLHGLSVRARVPRGQVAAARRALAEFPFHSETSALPDRA
jgi:fatty-acyl-CoA synthase